MNFGFPAASHDADHKFADGAFGRRKIGNGTRRRQFSFIDYGYRAADGVDLLQNMRAQYDRMLMAERPDQLPDLNDLLRIQSYGRLVQNQNLRVSDERLRNADSLLIPF